MEDTITLTEVQLITQERFDKSKNDTTGDDWINEAIQHNGEEGIVGSYEDQMEEITIEQEKFKQMVIKGEIQLVQKDAAMTTYCHYRLYDQAATIYKYKDKLYALLTE